MQVVSIPVIIKWFFFKMTQKIIGLQYGIWGFFFSNNGKWKDIYDIYCYNMMLDVLSFLNCMLTLTVRFVRSNKLLLNIELYLKKWNMFKLWIIEILFSKKSFFFLHSVSQICFYGIKFIILVYFYFSFT